MTAVITSRGVVRSGIGDCSRWLALLEEHYRRKTGMTLFPGSLNVELPEPYRVPPQPLRLEAHEYGGRVSVNIVPCRIFGRRAFILRTDGNEQGTADHPRTIVEIATDVKLRDAHSLRDGDIVEPVFVVTVSKLVGLARALRAAAQPPNVEEPESPGLS